LLKRYSSSLLFGSLLILLVVSGCTTYQNVTGYFNTYYNARKLFDEAVGDVRTQTAKDRDTNYFVRAVVPQNTQDKFDKVIEKGSKLIQFYPKSKWVDDAILMIAESYVYLGEYESGTRKFKELLDLFPESDLRFEGKLWDARAKYYLNQQDAALAEIKDLFPEARAKGENDILLESLMLQARIFWERAEFDQAASSYALAVEVSGDDAMRASAEYLLGQCYEKVGDKSKAAEAYGKVRNFNPGPTLDFQARLRYGSSLAATGEHSRALKILDDLNQDPLTIDQHALVDLEIGNTYLAVGDSAQAFALYAMIDTTYKHTDASARGYYRRARMYEQDRFDYKTARDFYNKAKAEFPASEITPVAARRAENLDHYFATFDRLRKNVDQYAEAVHRDSINAATSGFHEGSLIPPQPRLPATGETHAGRVDTSLAHAPVATSDLTRKQFLPPEATKEQLQPPAEEVPRSASESVRRRLSDRDLFRDEDEEPAGVPNVQRPNGAAVATNPAIANRKDSSSATAPAIGPAAEPISADSAAELLAGAYFELGGIYYLELNRLDSAEACYNTIIRDYSSSPYVPRALYALAEIEGSKHNSEGVDSLYKIILSRYGESEYAAQVRKTRGLEAVKVRTDSTESQYSRAQGLIGSGRPKEALKILKHIASTKNRSPLKPKAAYAVGWLYETVLLNNDSAAHWYRNLSSRYPSSVYAAEVRPKIAVLDNPNALKEYLKTKKTEPAGKFVDSLLQKNGPGQLPASSPRQTAVERIRERQFEELNKGNDVDTTSDEEDTTPDDEDVPDPDDDNN
jgi:TolA-binding protein